MKQPALSDILSNLRQLTFPAPFRIGREDGRFVLNRIENALDLLRQLIETSSSHSGSPAGPSTALVAEPRFLADLATRLWRIRAGLLKQGTREPVEEAQRSYRHLEKLLGVLEESGVRLVDNTGEIYDAGMTAEVVMSEPMKGIGREVVKETVRPAVFLGKRMIQIPQIVVGIPMPAGEPSS